MDDSNKKTPSSQSAAGAGPETYSQAPPQSVGYPQFPMGYPPQFMYYPMPPYMQGYPQSSMGSPPQETGPHQTPGLPHFGGGYPGFYPGPVPSTPQTGQTGEHFPPSQSAGQPTSSAGRTQVQESGPNQTIGPPYFSGHPSFYAGPLPSMPQTASNFPSQIAGGPKPLKGHPQQPHMMQMPPQMNPWYGYQPYRQPFQPPPSRTREYSQPLQSQPPLRQRWESTPNLHQGVTEMQSGLGRQGRQQSLNSLLEEDEFPGGNSGHFRRSNSTCSELGGDTRLSLDRIEVNHDTFPPTPPFSPTTADPLTATEGPPRTVKVRVGRDIQPKLVYKYYFQNAAIGGGQVEQVAIHTEERLVFVTFARAEDAARVSGRSHAIGEESVTVSLYVAPPQRPTYANKLLFHNLPDKLSSHHFRTLLKLVTGCAPVEILYGDEEGALVTFNERQDLERVQKNCQENDLDGRLLSVSRVPVSSAILVGNLNPFTAVDTVRFFFQNHNRSGGGPVQNVDMLADERKCIVHFKDHKVIKSVIGKGKLTLDKSALEITTYFECLGASGGSEDPDNFPVPKSFSLKDVARAKLLFFQKCPAFWEELHQLLSELHAVPKFVDDKVVVDCTLTPEVPRARHLARTWKAEAQDAVMKCLVEVIVHEILVPQETWPVVETKLDGVVHGLAIAATKPDDRSLIVVGKEPSLTKLLEDIRATLKKEEAEIERKKLEVEETVTLEPHQVRLLEAKRFPSSQSDVLVKTDSQKFVIVFQGNKFSVKDARLQMYELLQSVKAEQWSNISNAKQTLLQNKQGERFIMEKLKRKGVVAVWEIAADQEHITFYAFTVDDAKKAISIADASLVEDAVLCRDSADLLQGPEWNDFVKELTDRHAGVLIISTNPKDQKISITCKDDILQSTQKEIHDFRERNTILTEVVSFSKNRQNFVVSFWSLKLQKIIKKLAEEKVQITSQKTDFTVKGTRRGLAEVWKKLQVLGQQVVVHKETFTALAMVKYFRHPECQQGLDLIGSSNKCIIALEFEPDSTLQVKVEEERKVKFQDGVKVGDIADTKGHGFGGKAVYHSTLPHWSSANSKENLRDVVTMYLTKASGQGSTSMNLSFLDAGQLSYPRDETARIMLETVNTFQRASPSTSLRDVRIVVKHKDTEALQEFRHVLDGRPTVPGPKRVVSPATAKPDAIKTAVIEGEIAEQKEFRKMFDGRATTVPVPSAVSSPVTTKADLIKVSVIEGEIAEQKVDVIVNTATCDLNLSIGAVSASLLKKAGQALQDECKTKFPDGVKVGDLADTKGHGLACKAVYHLTMPAWSNANSKENLQDVVSKCLTKASSQGHTSLVFPALGTGQLNYPRDETAHIMLDTVDTFQRASPSTSVRDVRIVVYQKDTDTLKTFRQIQGQHIPTPVSGQSLSSVASASASGLINVSIVEGEIADQKVDVLVNTATPGLNLQSGAVSASLLKKAGQALQDECKTKFKDGVKVGEIADTKGHGLRCKAVYHLTLPGWKSANSKQNLQEVVSKCLTKASSQGHTSLVFPALGTGQLSYPRDETARIMLDTVDTFQRTSPTSSLRDVRIVVYQKDADTLKIFRQIHGKHSSTGQSLSSASAASSTTVDVINVSVVEGEIAQQKADVIVNTTTPDLNLKSGAVSTSLLNKAGQALQDECKTKFTAAVKVGDIADTKGHGLACKTVYHLTLPNWSSANSEKNLREVVSKCLTKASSQGHTSLVFPALGTGQLNYPRDETARIMLDTVDTFQRASPSTSLRDVRIVVYHKDKETVQEFKHVHDERKRVVPQLQRLSELNASSRQDRKFGEKMFCLPLKSAVGKGPASAQFYIDGLSVHLRQGDILDEDADILVNICVDLAKGSGGSALAARCGEPLEETLKAKASELKGGGVAVTPGFQLKCRYLLHVNMDKFLGDLSGAITRFLDTAESCDAKSIALPDIGTEMRFEVNEVASALLKAVSKFQKEKPASVQELRCIFSNATKMEEFTDALQSEADRIKKEAENAQPATPTAARSILWKVLRRGKSPQARSTVAPVLEVVRPVTEDVQPGSPHPPTFPSALSADVYVYAESKPDATGALKALEDFVKDKFPLVVLEEEALKQMEKSVLDKLRQAGAAHDVEVTVKQTAGQLELHGHSKNIIKTQVDIKDIISGVERRRHEERAEDLICKMVQWSYLEVTTTGYTPQEYEKRQNKIIEEAFLDKQKCAKLVDNAGKTYIIDFETMREYVDTNKDDFVQVIRRDKTGLDTTEGELPTTWLPHPKGENLQMVPLKSSDKEYNQVAKSFMATLNTDLTSLPTTGIQRIEATIVSIDRVQNQLQMRHYMAKKGHMDRQNPRGTQNERTLWHGTTSVATQSINQDGFNRSYCGKNATAFGQGVYFAVNSSYSAQPTYSEAEAGTGNSYIYQCKVLTGCATKGEHKMRYLPKRNGKTSFDSATNDVKKPSMYVIFSDTQAYPEYLITFKKDVTMNPSSKTQ